MKNEKYEQMELDTRADLIKAIDAVAEDAIGIVQEMIGACGESPSRVRNRHEAYGIAAAQMVNINTAVKHIKGDIAVLLGTLENPNYPALEAVSSICNSATSAAAVLLRASAEMKRTLNNLYFAETHGDDLDDTTPMEAMAAAATDEEYEDADITEADDLDEE